MPLFSTSPTPSRWPDAATVLLLRAAVLPPAQAFAAWTAYRGTLRPDVTELLPAVYANLRHQACAPSEVRLLRQAHARAWQQTEQVLRAARPAMAALHAAGYDPVILKGAALAQTCYTLPGSRPFGDIDVHVARPVFAAAVALLRAAGWRPREDPRSFDPRFEHALTFFGPAGGIIDLHAHPLSHFWLAPAPARAATRPLALGGLAVRQLEPAMQLLQALESAVLWRRDRSPRSFVDAARLIGGAVPVDPTALATAAATAGLTATTQLGLGFLRDSLGIAAAAPLLDALAPLRVTALERRVLAASGRDLHARPLANLRHKTLRLRGVLAQTGGPIVPTIAAYVRHVAGTPRLALLPVIYAGKLANMLRHRAALARGEQAG